MPVTAPLLAYIGPGAGLLFRMPLLPLTVVAILGGVVGLSLLVRSLRQRGDSPYEGDG